MFKKSKSSKRFMRRRTQPKLNFLRKAWVRKSDRNITLGKVPGLEMPHRLKNIILVPRARSFFG